MRCGVASLRSPLDAAEPLGYGPRRLAELLAARAVSASDLTAEVLARIEHTQPTVNAFRRVRAGAAFAEAREADRRLAAGERLPLLGVPIAVKDDADLAGEPTAFGCAGEFPVAVADCEMVRLLKAAGAVIVGKTNCPELGHWPFTEGSAFGATRNPWSLNHTPGGSSGGSAAAVAAGVVPVAVGSDGAGSIRIPAAWTNLVGIKPQRGRVSIAPARETFHGMSAAGPLARTVGDAAMLLDVLSGRWRQGEGTFAAAARREPGRLRIALSLRPPFSGYPVQLDPRVRVLVERLAHVLVELGHDVVRADPPYGLIGLNFLARSTAGLDEWSARVPDRSLLDPRLIERLRAGRRYGRPMVGLSQASSVWFERRLSLIFRVADVVLAPSTATPPPRVGEWAGLDIATATRAMVAACPYAWPWNVVGWPAVNVPAGRTADGLPIGAQLLGPPCGEARLISLAAQLEERERWFDHRPPTVVR